MDTRDLLQLYVDTILGPEDTSTASKDLAPGFAAADFALLGRLLFWPGLASLLLLCTCLIQGFAAS